MQSAQGTLVRNKYLNLGLPDPKNCSLNYDIILSRSLDHIRKLKPYDLESILKCPPN